jgi:hypothetical protein
MNQEEQQQSRSGDDHLEDDTERGKKFYRRKNIGEEGC